MKCLKRCVFQCIKSLKMDFVKSKKGLNQTLFIQSTAYRHRWIIIFCSWGGAPLFIPIGTIDYPSCLLSKCARAEIHSVMSHIRIHFVLEWKSTLKLVESILKRLSNHNFGIDSTKFLEWLIQLRYEAISNMTHKRVDFHSLEFMLWKT